jgi:hypothetical protein
MKKLKIIAGTTWAILCLLLVLILFPGMGSLAGSLAKLPFMKINPNFSGGEVAKHIPHENYETVLRKPVFDGLTGERKRGYVQVDWAGSIPSEIRDTIDYNSDGSPDFFISIDTTLQSTVLTALNGKVGKIRISTPTSKGWSVRVNLVK